MQKIYKVAYSGGVDEYQEIVSLPEDAKLFDDKPRQIQNSNESFVDLVLAGKTIETDTHHYLAVEGVRYGYNHNGNRYAVIEWSDSVIAVEKDWFGPDEEFIHLDEPTVNPIVEDSTSAPYAPYTDDDMELLRQEPISEIGAHTIAHDDKMVVYKFSGDIVDAMQKSTHYGRQWDVDGQTYTTAFVHARVMTDKYINDNRYGKTGDYRVADHWYRTGKAGLNVTCWQVVDVDMTIVEQGHKMLSDTSYTGDWDYDTRGRGEYSKKDGSVRGHHDVDYQD